MTNSRPLATLDVPRPAHLSVPSFRRTSGPEVTALAASAGLHLDPWQQHVLEVGLAERDDGQWMSRLVALVVGRQNGKGSILEALELAALFLFGCRTIVHTAHLFKTSSEAFVRLLQLVESTPDLDRLVQSVHRSHGSEGIELVSGERIWFGTRTGGAGRGLSPDLIIVDEAYNLNDRAVSALFPSMSARPNPQAWITSSAPTTLPESDVLRRYCRQGREGAPGLTFIEYCADVDPTIPLKDLDLSDPVLRAQANPGYPHRIGDEAIDVDQFTMTVEDFCRERFGIWLDDDDGEWVIPAAAWLATEDDGSDIEGPQTWALEVSPDRDWAALAAGGRSSLFPDRKHGTVTDYEPGTSWVVARAKQRTDQFGGVVAVVKGSPAWTLLPALKKAKVPTREVSTAEHAAACGQLYDACLSDPLGFVHRAQGELTTALRLAVKKDNGDGGWVWSRKRSGGDISPLVAVTVAVALVPEQPRARFVDLAAY